MLFYRLVLYLFYVEEEKNIYRFDNDYFYHALRGVLSSLFKKFNAKDITYDLLLKEYNDLGKYEYVHFHHIS